ncbi:MAG: arsenate reductase ArsC [Bacilli bacterium]|jgi:arsenate reductase|nr:arsenate reductase ArsC [Bacilli bacterium]
MKKYKVAFICVHNSCRSQMAEAISKLLASDTFEIYSAGTHIKNQINQDAVKVIKDIYHVDMEETQKSKLIDSLPDIDIIVTMGCEVECPYLPSLHREDWGLDDPTSKPIEVFIETAKLIESKVIDLVKRVKNGLIP